MSASMHLAGDRRKYLPILEWNGTVMHTHDVIETCVMPTLLFGSQNWIVSGGILEQLESFLGKLAKRALKWPKQFSNTAAMTVLD